MKRGLSLVLAFSLMFAGALPVSADPPKNESSDPSLPAMKGPGEESQSAVSDPYGESEDGSPAVSRFQRLNYHWYYFDEAGSRVTGWQQIGQDRYYFDESGIMAQSWQELDGENYYFSSDGRLVRNDWVGDRYVNGKGVLVPELHRTGWHTEAPGKRYVRSDGSSPRDCLERIGDHTYYFNENGYVVKGWRELEDSWYYFDEKGIMATDWKQIRGRWHLFRENGTMVTGWQKSGKNWRWFDKNGYMTIGWKKIGEKWYYFNPSGCMITGWRDIRGETYHFDESGAMDTGWIRIDRKDYYFNSDGAMEKDTFVGYFYVDEQGAWDPTVVRPIWKRLGLRWWYCHTDGSYTVSDFELIDGEIYYFDRKGYMVTGWENIDGQRYYFDRNGVMQTGWRRIGFHWYYFYADGVMAADTRIDGYDLGKDGIRKTAS